MHASTILPLAGRAEAAKGKEEIDTKAAEAMRGT